MFYSKCETCGANLDPGEKCDCVRESSAIENEVKAVIFNHEYEKEYENTYIRLHRERVPSSAADDSAKESAEAKAYKISQSVIDSYRRIKKSAAVEEGLTKHTLL
ncbi:MAG: hypothetical protein LBU94_01695 [Clostridiales bacterium]|jgi:hypothetical protein|nr:hypothetical protein [Clostridiales bacterium]